MYCMFRDRVGSGTVSTRNSGNCASKQARHAGSDACALRDTACRGRPGQAGAGPDPALSRDLPVERAVAVATEEVPHTCIYRRPASTGVRHRALAARRTRHRACAPIRQHVPGARARRGAPRARRAGINARDLRRKDAAKRRHSRARVIKPRALMALRAACSRCGAARLPAWRGAIFSGCVRAA
eukprot:IDg15000t1